MAGDGPDVNMPSESSDPGAAETPSPSGLGALSDDDRAGAGIEIGRMINEIDAQDKADPFPNLDFKDDPHRIKRWWHWVHYGEPQIERADRRNHHRAYLIGILALLGGAAIAGALLFTNLAGRTTPRAGGVGAPAVESAPATDAAPVPGTDAAQPTPTATVDPSSAPVIPDTWRFTGKYAIDLTITLLPEREGYGRISVKGAPKAKGSYTWNGSTLKIAYKNPVTLLTGNVVDTKGRITCTGEPTSAKVRCTLRGLAWTSTSTTQSSQWLRFTATGRPIE